MLAYGQTGSGKSHTLIGKLGSFKNPSMDMENIHPELGIFPRIAFNLFKEIQNKKENTAMTI